ncbi:nucleotide exchange factor GrpE [Candidatus Microgenomates bacterium]|nr:nucleotide exchange factor GrpE [Candidatus Microgenomates bacterium]
MVKKKKKLTKLEEEVLELTNKWKRACADYDNLEKRMRQEKEEFVKFAGAVILDKLLPVLDSLEKCQVHLKDKGLGLILSQFKKVLESEELEEIQVAGEEFDPQVMDAVEMIKGEKNKVIEVVLKGYQLNKKVLRPAKVKVGIGG